MCYNVMTFTFFLPHFIFKADNLELRISALVDCYSPLLQDGIHFRGQTAATVLVGKCAYGIKSGKGRVKVTYYQKLCLIEIFQQPTTCKIIAMYVNDRKGCMTCVCYLLTVI
ncbi:hypothetical protein PR048_005731 [Dryococelus australis]|uniref:Secreted protein n=1 Tax=Dryococelus australis TaxID=614101 RepID=A0ABQ9I910_9NEOP|nr:hypothetical protein PR048_005731 [Dryococelus australis]